MKQSGKQNLRSSELKNLAAIVLAAGKGKRMNSKDVNKVALLLAKKPMIVHTFELLERLNIKTIVLVVGFAKESVIKLLKGKAIFAHQKKRMGTAHAVSLALRKLPKSVYNVLILNGDDSAFYKAETIKKLVQTHFMSNASFTFLTIDMNNPKGLGRVVRDKKGRVLAIVEDKDASENVRKIKEVNPACYVFKTSYLKKYLPKVPKSPVSGEYYLTHLIDLGVKYGEKIETLAAGQLAWRGVNTKEELVEAENLFHKAKRA